jgi:hypothetical protein
MGFSASGFCSGACQMVNSLPLAVAPTMSPAGICREEGTTIRGCASEAAGHGSVAQLQGMLHVAGLHAAAAGHAPMWAGCRRPTGRGQSGRLGRMPASPPPMAGRRKE